jgi:hypothetical protein
MDGESNGENVGENVIHSPIPTHHHQLIECGSGLLDGKREGNLQARRSQSLTCSAGAKKVPKHFVPDDTFEKLLRLQL